MQLEKSIEGEGGMHFIVLNEAESAPLRANGNKRVLCTFSNGEKVHAALNPIKAGGCYLYISKALLKKLNAKLHSPISFELEIDTTLHQFQMPEELKEVLALDYEAEAVFKTLTPGNQRSLMHLITTVKSSDKRIEKALKMMEYLKIGITSAQKMKL